MNILVAMPTYEEHEIRLKKACPDGGNIFAIYGSPTDKNVEEVEKGFKDALVDSKLNIVYSGYCDNWLA